MKRILAFNRFFIKGNKMLLFRRGKKELEICLFMLLQVIILKKIKRISKSLVMETGKFFSFLFFHKSKQIKNFVTQK